MRRLAIAGLSLLAAVGLVVGGCAKGDTGGQSAKGSPASASPIPTDPKSVLLASVQQFRKTSWRYHAKSGVTTIDAIVDPAHNALFRSTTTQDGPTPTKTEEIQLGNDYWLRYVPPSWLSKGVPLGKYAHLDLTKLGANSPLAVSLNKITTAAGMFDGLVEVKQVDSQHLAGTTDLSKMNANLEKDGEPVMASFTVVLDSQGRLTELKLDMPSLDSDEDLAASYSDYGTTAKISKPAESETVEAPQDVYDMFTAPPQQ